MSGHSKWSTIKHQKAATDKKRGEIFGKLARAITMAAREGGSADPSANARLRTAIEKAREFNMPTDNIARAAQRGAGGGEGSLLENFSFDAVGPGGIAMLIEGITDNRNRTVPEVRKILENHGGKLAGEGASRWAFQQSGIITVNPSAQKISRDDLEMELIGAGAHDIQEHEGMLEMLVPKEELLRVRGELSEKNIVPESAEVGWVPQQTAELPVALREGFEALVQELDDHADIQTIWSNEK